MVREQRKQYEQLKYPGKQNDQIEIQVKNWLTINPSMGITVSKKIMIFEEKRWANATGTVDFTALPS